MMSNASADLRKFEPDELDRRIINRLQEGFPLAPRPFEIVARELNCAENTLIERLEQLREAGVITRFGPFFNAEAMGGAFCLCAMAVPNERFDDVTHLLSNLPAVAHNYERDHVLNMWFVLATEAPENIDHIVCAIAQATTLEVLRFPKLEEYFIGFKVAA